MGSARRRWRPCYILVILIYFCLHISQCMGETSESPLGPGLSVIYQNTTTYYKCVAMETFVPNTNNATFQLTYSIDRPIVSHEAGVSAYSGSIVLMSNNFDSAAPNVVERIRHYVQHGALGLIVHDNSMVGQWGNVGMFWSYETYNHMHEHTEVSSFPVCFTNDEAGKALWSGGLEHKTAIMRYQKNDWFEFRQSTIFMIFRILVIIPLGGVICYVFNVIIKESKHDIGFMRTLRGRTITFNLVGMMSLMLITIIDPLEGYGVMSKPVYSSLRTAPLIAIFFSLNTLRSLWRTLVNIGQQHAVVDPDSPARYSESGRKSAAIIPVEDDTVLTAVAKGRDESVIGKLRSQWNLHEDPEGVVARWTTNFSAVVLVLSIALPIPPVVPKVVLGVSSGGLMFLTVRAGREFRDVLKSQAEVTGNISPMAPRVDLFNRLLKNIIYVTLVFVVVSGLNSSLIQNAVLMIILRLLIVAMVIWFAFIFVKMLERTEVARAGRYTSQHGSSVFVDTRMLSVKGMDGALRQDELEMLVEMLQQPLGQRLLGRYASEQNDVEALFCCVDIYEYKALRGEAYRTVFARQLYNTYIAPGAPLCLIDLTSAVREQVETDMQELLGVTPGNGKSGTMARANRSGSTSSAMGDFWPARRKNSAQSDREFTTSVGVGAGLGMGGTDPGSDLNGAWRGHNQARNLPKIPSVLQLRSTPKKLGASPLEPHRLSQSTPADADGVNGSPGTSSSVGAGSEAGGGKRKRGSPFGSRRSRLRVGVGGRGGSRRESDGSSRSPNGDTTNTDALTSVNGTAAHRGGGGSDSPLSALPHLKGRSAFPSPNSAGRYTVEDRGRDGTGGNGKSHSSQTTLALDLSTPAGNRGSRTPPARLSGQGLVGARSDSIPKAGQQQGQGQEQGQGQIEAQGQGNGNGGVDPASIDSSLWPDVAPASPRFRSGGRRVHAEVKALTPEERLERQKAQGRIFDTVREQQLLHIGRDIFIPFMETPEYQQYLRKRETAQAAPRPQDFMILAELGRGSYGVVLRCRKRSSGVEFAVKMTVKQQHVNEQVTKMIPVTKERDNMLCVGSFPFVAGLSYAFHDESCTYLAMDLVKGHTLKQLLKAGVLRKPEVMKFSMAVLALALDHVHNTGVVYRDLKPENVVMNQGGYPVLIDLGLASPMWDPRSEADETERAFRAEQCRYGTPGYVPPEVYECHHRGRYPFVGPSADWWAYGVILYEVTVGERPESVDISAQEIYEAMRKARAPPPLANLVAMLLEPDMEFRLTQPVKRRRHKPHSERQSRSGRDQRDPRNPRGRGDPGDRGGQVSPQYEQSPRPGGLESLKRHKYFEGVDWELLMSREATPPYLDQSQELNKLLTEENEVFESFEAVKKHMNEDAVKAERFKPECHWKTQVDEAASGMFNEFDYVSPTTMKEELGIASAMQARVRLARLQQAEYLRANNTGFEEIFEVG